MPTEFPRFTQCLAHQLPESQPSPLGLVCPICKHRMRVTPPTGKRMAFWESQPGAYFLNGDPCFIFTLIWDDFRIRSLHPAGSDTDPRARRIPIAAESREADWHDDLPPEDHPPM